jgi:hypothetical protein
MSDDDFVHLYDNDENFRMQVKAASAAQLIHNPQPPPPSACLKSSIVSKGTKMELRLSWKARFVTSANFNKFFQLPPASVPGLKVGMEIGFDGVPVEGVFLPPSAKWPSGLPYADAEVVSVRELGYQNLIHDRTDLHLDHGENIWNMVVSGSVKQRQACLQSHGSFLAMESLDMIADKVKQVIKDRQANVAAIVPGSAPAQPVVMASSRLAAAMASGDGQRQGGKGSAGASSRGNKAAAKASGGGGGKGASSAAPPLRRKGSSRIGGSGGGGVFSDVASLACTTAAGSGGGPESGAQFLSFEPPTAPKEVKGSPVKDSVSVAGSMASGAQDVQLGGVRGIGRKVDIADIFQGYNPGRELPAASMLVATF